MDEEKGLLFNQVLAEVSCGPGTVLAILGSQMSFIQQKWVKHFGTSLVAQWLRICLPVQGTRVRTLVWEDPTCHRTIKPVRHNY